MDGWLDLSLNPARQCWMSAASFRGADFSLYITSTPTLMSFHHNETSEFRDLPHRQEDIQAFLSYSQDWLRNLPNGSKILEIQAVDLPQRQKLAAEAVKLFNKHGFDDVLSLKFVGAIMRTAAIYIDSLPLDNRNLLPPGWQSLSFLYADPTLPVITTRILNGYVQLSTGPREDQTQVADKGFVQIPAVAIRALQERIDNSKEEYKKRYGRNPGEARSRLVLRVSQEQLQTIPQTSEEIANVKQTDEGRRNFARHQGYVSGDFLTIVENLRFLEDRLRTWSGDIDKWNIFRLSVRKQRAHILEKLESYVGQNMGVITKTPCPTLESLGISPEIQQAIHDSFDDYDAHEIYSGLQPWGLRREERSLGDWKGQGTNRNLSFSLELHVEIRKCVRVSKSNAVNIIFIILYISLYSMEANPQFRGSYDPDRTVHYWHLPNRAQSIKAFLDFVGDWLLENSRNLPDSARAQDLSEVHADTRQQLASAAVQHGFRDVLQIRFVRAIMKTALMYINSLPSTIRHALPDGWQQISEYFRYRHSDPITTNLVLQYIEGRTEQEHGPADDHPEIIQLLQTCQEISPMRQLHGHYATPTPAAQMEATQTQTLERRQGQHQRRDSSEYEMSDEEERSQSTRTSEYVTDEIDDSDHDTIMDDPQHVMAFVSGIQEYERQRLNASSTKNEAFIQSAITAHRTYILVVYNNFIEQNQASITRSVTMTQLGVPPEVQAVVVEALDDVGFVENLDRDALSAVARTIARRRPR
ncbi:hypothetical protein BDN72DRAFT_864660 [Pluteus cervinus]|uniref:Uncharacterized protein n=1 Tax=Pluteus cervinus TaxID=181527 RepID=A0ACD3A327_9AGAR|nr:hypothetical protein BDN72DRAFT_864660 [Pluteus cervinus]